MNIFNGVERMQNKYYITDKHSTIERDLKLSEAIYILKDIRNNYKNDSSNYKVSKISKRCFYVYNKNDHNQHCNTYSINK